MTPRRHVSALLVLALPLLIGANGKGCKKKAPEDDTEEIDPDDTTAQLIEVRLGVVMVNPASVSAGKPFKATVLGSAFEPGARVYIGRIGGDATTRDENTITVDMPALKEGSWDIEVINPDGSKAVLRDGLTATESTVSCAHLRLHFDLDSSDLGAPEKAALEENISCWTSASGAIRIEGHCDERGTTDYNVALGQRRANGVESYLSTRGVRKSRLTTVSFGEERPLESSGGESGWAQNRRAEIYLSE